jgi:hypothetical protein
MALTATEKLDITNIALMAVSCCAAFIIPFELFLFSYAILGPLHYLTEISWLHDKKYYTKEKYDIVILVVIGLLLTLNYFATQLELAFPERFDTNLIYIAFLCALVFVTVKNPFYRIGGIVLIIFTSQLAQNFYVFFSVFIPTMIHVYVFTGLFMIYGAIKSKSRIGFWSVAALILCPFILYNVYPDRAFYPATAYSITSLDFFRIVNISWLKLFNEVPKQSNFENWNKIIFHSQAGILFMRFVAFAYTYHYLNWFSKTKIIQWHKVPKSRFAAVIVIWLVSIAIYITDYMLGVQWLLFLSLLHVMLELPLNFTSIIAIGKFFGEKLTRPLPAKANKN